MAHGKGAQPRFCSSRISKLRFAWIEPHWRIWAKSL